MFQWYKYTSFGRLDTEINQNWNFHHFCNFLVFCVTVLQKTEDGFKMKFKKNVWRQREQIGPSAWLSIKCTFLNHFLNSCHKSTLGVFVSRYERKSEEIKSTSVSQGRSVKEKVSAIKSEDCEWLWLMWPNRCLRLSFDCQN